MHSFLRPAGIHVQPHTNTYKWVHWFKHQAMSHALTPLICEADSRRWELYQGGRVGQGDCVNVLLEWSWASLCRVRLKQKQCSTTEVQLGLWRSFHRPQDRGLDSAQVVQQLSAGPSKIRMLPRFSGSLWNGNNRLHARDQINQTPDWREEEEEVNRGVV